MDDQKKLYGYIKIVVKKTNHFDTVFHLILDDVFLLIKLHEFYNRSLINIFLSSIKSMLFLNYSLQLKKFGADAVLICQILFETY